LTASPIAPRRRLTRSADFDAVYRRGRSRSNRHLVAWVFPREGADREAARIGITVPRKVGTAVARSLVKRQVREAMAQVPQVGLLGTDVVIVARAGLPEAIETSGFAWLVAELTALVAPSTEPPA
jgi:ribonuclease P protein component